MAENPNALPPGIFKTMVSLADMGSEGMEKLVTAQGFDQKEVMRRVYSAGVPEGSILHADVDYKNKILTVYWSLKLATKHARSGNGVLLDNYGKPYKK